MSRTKASVKSVYWNLARGLGFEPDTAINSSGVSTAVQAVLLRCINSAHEDAYEANEWEDAWTDGTLTPSSGTITYATVGDASRFTLWSEDPRTYNSSAYPIRCVTSNDGIHVQSDATTVFAFWLPKVAAFTNISSTDLVIIESIAAAVEDLARAEYLRSTGQPETAEIYEAKGRGKLEDRWAVEFQRVQRCHWLRPIY